VRPARLTALAAAACLALAWLHAGAALGADGPPVTDRTVKAAFLYKFASYVEWPGAQPAAGTPLTIGVIGSSDMAGELSRITEGRTVNERPVQVRVLDAGGPLAGVQVLFVGSRGSERDASLQAARGLPILVVTDAPGALASGSMINFTLDRDRVRFEVSLPAAESSHLKLSSRLLAVAQRVERQ
jgi:hypothetical protein